MPFGTRVHAIACLARFRNRVPTAPNAQHVT
jgi:hypothetical protein